MNCRCNILIIVHTVINDNTNDNIEETEHIVDKVVVRSDDEE